MPAEDAKTQADCLDTVHNDLVMLDAAERRINAAKPEVAGLQQRADASENAR